VRITSIAHETGRARNLVGFRARMAQEFAVAFERDAMAVSPERLMAVLAAPVAG
jgi:hypothetical protein